LTAIEEGGLEIRDSSIDYITALGNLEYYSKEIQPSVGENLFSADVESAVRRALRGRLKSEVTWIKCF